LGEVQILDALVEIEVGCGCDAEGSPAQISAVEVELQDLVLGEVRFEPEGEEGLLDLALHRAIAGEEQVLGQLLGQRGATLYDGASAHVFRHGAGETDEIDAVMFEEAPVLRGKHGLDDVVRHFLDGNGVALDDAALADLVTVAVEEGNGVIVLGAPVALGFLEGGEGKRKHEHSASGAEREALAGQFNKEAAKPCDAEAPEENRNVFPSVRQLEACFIERGIDPGIKPEEAL